MTKNIETKVDMWVDQYITPIMVELNPLKAVENYKANKRADFEQKLEEAGVYDSLKRLEKEGTSEDKIFGEMRKGILRADPRTKKYMKLVDDFDYIKERIDEDFGESGSRDRYLDEVRDVALNPPVFPMPWEENFSIWHMYEPKIYMSKGTAVPTRVRSLSPAAVGNTSVPELALCYLGERDGDCQREGEK